LVVWVSDETSRRALADRFP